MRVEIKRRLITEYHQNDEILIFESTVPKTTVYSTQYYNDSVEFIIVIICLANRDIKVYKFDSRVNSLSLLTHIKSVNWEFYGVANWLERKELSYRESFLIDDSFMIDNDCMKWIK